VPLAALADDISNFFGAVGDFFGRLAEIQLLKRSRLSVVPVSKEHFDRILKMGKTKIS